MAFFHSLMFSNNKMFSQDEKQKGRSENGSSVGPLTSIRFIFTVHRLEQRLSLCGGDSQRSGSPSALLTIDNSDSHGARDDQRWPSGLITGILRLYSTPMRENKGRFTMKNSMCHDSTMEHHVNFEAHYKKKLQRGKKPQWRNQKMELEHFYCAYCFTIGITFT